MSLRLGEIGKRIGVISNYDMSSNTSLQIIAVPPSGELNQKTWTATIGSSLTNITLQDGTTVASVNANEWMYYDTTSADDLDEAGVWTLVGIYNNGSGTLFKTTPASLTVTDDSYNAS